MPGESPDDDTASADPAGTVGSGGLVGHVGRRRFIPGPKVLRAVAVAVVLVIVVGAGGAYALYRHFNGQITRVNIRLPVAAASPAASATASSSLSSATPPIARQVPKVRSAEVAASENLLLMGSDSRSFEGGQAYNVAPGSAAYVTGQRSDVVMLLHIPAGGAAATVISFPRDSWVQLPAFTDSAGVSHQAVMAKLNAAFDLGGAPLLVSAIEDLTGIHVDHFASINFPGFQGMVNAIGGINVCIGTTRHDSNSGDFLTAGDHHLDGVQALALVRDRESFADQDLGRIKDQEYFLSVMLRQVLSAGTLTNPFKLTEFLNVATKSLTVDSGMSIGDLRSLAARFSHVNSANVTFETVPVENANYRITSSAYGGQTQSAVELDPVAAGSLFASLAGASPSSPSIAAISADQVQVSVENGTATAGLAHQVAAQLRIDGFTVTETGDAPTTDEGPSVITYGPAGLLEAQALRTKMPDAQLKLGSATGTGVTLILGADSTVASPTAAANPVAPTTATAASDLSCAP